MGMGSGSGLSKFRKGWVVTRRGSVFYSDKNESVVTGVMC